MTALEGAKRKAGSPPEGADARSKRQPADQPAAGPLEERRLELAEVYAAYTALASAPPGAPPPEQPYLRLLKAGQGAEGCRRLAARLLPRYARHFPQHADTAADTLIALAKLSLSEPQQQVAARCDAAAGLPEVAAAAAKEAGSGGQQATIKLVAFCFQQLAALLSASAASTANGGSHLLPNGGTGSGSASGAGSTAADAASAFESHLWPCLDRCFASHFRVVLAACLHALKSPGEPNFAVASRFLSQRLLAAPGVAAAAAASPAGPADSSGDEVMQDASDSGAAAGGVAAAPAAAAAVVAGMLPADAQQQGGGQAEQPLAARVLGGLAAKDQAWVRSHVEKWSKEVDAKSSLEALGLLERLLSHLPAGEAVRAPGWLAASVLPELALPTRGAGGGEQPAAAATEQQQQQQAVTPPSAKAERQAAAGRGWDRGASPSPSRSRSRSRSSDAPLQRGRQGAGSAARGSGGVARGRRRASPGSPHLPRRRTPSPWRTQQRQRSESPWRPQRQRSSSPWRRWSPGPSEPRDARDGPAPGRRRGGSSPPPRRGSRRSLDAEDISPPASPRFPRMPPGFPQPAASPCLAASCLFFQGLPPKLEERDLRAECSKHSKQVECAVRPPGTQGIAFVTFKSVRDASRCYEAMCDALPWRDRGQPLQLTFVAQPVYPPGAPQRPQPRANHVWMAGVGSAADEAEVLRCCREGAIPPPEHLLKVPARRPGLMLVFRDTAVAEAAVAAIRAGRPRILGPPMPGGPPPGGRGGPPPGPGSAADSGSPAPRRGGSPGGRRGEREQRERGRDSGRERERERGDRERGGEERGEGQGVPLPPPEFAGRTLWVGQVPQGMHEDQLLDLFRQCGDIAGHKFLRHTACMFVDFARLEAAVEARSRLDGYRVAGGCLRVEFKNENQFWGPGGRGPPRRERQLPFGARDGPASPPRGGRERYGQHPPFREGGRDSGREGGRSGSFRERGSPERGGRSRSPDYGGRGREGPGRQAAGRDRGRSRSPSSSRSRSRCRGRSRSREVPRARSSGWGGSPGRQQPGVAQQAANQQQQQQQPASPREGRPAAEVEEGSRKRRWDAATEAGGAQQADQEAQQQPAQQTKAEEEQPQQQQQPPAQQQQPQQAASQPPPPAAPAAVQVPPAVPERVLPQAAPPQFAAPAAAAAAGPPGGELPRLFSVMSGNLPPGMGGAAAAAAAAAATAAAPPGIGLPPPPSLPPPAAAAPPAAPKPPPPPYPPPPAMGPPGFQQPAAARAPPVLRPPQQPPPPAAPPGTPPWRGTVAKSRAPVCAAVCLDGPSPNGALGGWAAAEPQQWPATLDVAHRADLQYVCTQLLAGKAPGERAIRRIAAADPSGRQPLLDFAQYLRSKSRAGVVALPPLMPQGIQRTMYLVPPSEEVCRQLGISWQVCSDCLLALIVPMALGQ